MRRATGIVPAAALVAFAVVLVALAAPAVAQTEAEMRDRLCADLAREVRTPAGTFADCVSDSRAIEIDWTEKWAEAIGQSLHYAAELGLHPGIILICRQAEGTCLAHRLRLESTLAASGIWMTAWYCARGDKRLADCAVRKLVPAP